MKRSVGMVAVVLAVCVVQSFAKEPGSAMVEKQAAGEFDVKMKPEEVSAVAKDSGIGRMSLDKVFRGDLAAASTGEMLMFLTPVKGSAAYVAIERVTGTLAGKSGSFVLQHNGVMDNGKQSLALSVVPDSGTGALTGIRGTMTIDIRDGKHFYAFTYALPEAAE